MKKTLLVVCSLLLSVAAVAQVLTPDVALDNALAKMRQGAAASSRARVARLQKSGITLAFTEKSSDQTPLVYVYSMQGGGFLLASADSRSHALLGYTDTGSYEDLKQSVAFQGWLADCTGALEWLSRQPMGEKASAEAGDGQTLATSVSPILGDIEWSQENPYNLWCPIRTNDAGTYSALAPTGCVATATAQVMAHYKWPLQGTGSHTNANEETQYYDFGATKYQWDLIKPKYKSDAAGDSALAIAELMAHVGCAEDMYYGFGSSGSDTPQVLYALTHFFGYDKSARFEQRKFYTTPDWNALLRDELDAQRPIVMGANSWGGGHEFVIDGYDINGLYHINWGWGGTSNGYFDMNILNPDQQGTGGGEGNFDMDQDVVVNIRIDSLGTSVGLPYLRIHNQIKYDANDEKEFSFSFYNRGAGDFSGVVGFALIDPSTEQVLDTTCVSFQQEPLQLYDGACELYYHIPDTIRLKTDYIVQPYYRLTPDGEMNSICTQIGAEKFLVSYIDEATGRLAWGYDYEHDLPALTCTDVKVIRNYVGFPPKFQVTLSNSSNSQVEYNETVAGWVFLNTESQSYDFCMGATQCFLNPGESKSIYLECDSRTSNTNELSYRDLKAGEYQLMLLYKSGDQHFQLGDEYYPFTMIAEDTCDLAYSNFALDKTVVCKGDTLKATFDATNYGGFTSDDYTFSIYAVDNFDDRVSYFSVSRKDIPGHGATTSVTLQGAVQLQPGEYVGYFSNDNTGYDIVNDGFRFTVADEATGVTSIQPVNRQMTIYDLLGRRVETARQSGIYIINGKKVVK